MRRAYLKIFYIRDKGQGQDQSKQEETDITEYIVPNLSSFTFTENADGEADDLTLILADPDRLWQGPWKPEISDKISPTIVCENWSSLGESCELNCGEFEVDEVILNSNAAGDTITIKATPALKSSLAYQKKTRFWEGSSLERIAKDLAEDAGMELVYRAEAIHLKRVDQRQETDLAFLQKLCTNHGCRLKISSSSLILFEGKKADSLGSVTITPQIGNNALNLKQISMDLYSKAEITYFDPVKGEHIVYSFAPENPPATVKILTLNLRAENRSHAERIAKSELRKKNAEEKQGEWSGMGDPLLRAGGTAILSGWGKFDETYSISQVIHKIASDQDGSYTSKITLKKALDY